MKLEIINILKVVKHVSACDVLCLFNSGITILPKQYDGESSLNNLINAIKLLNKKELNAVKNFPDYILLKEKYPNFSHVVFSDSGNGNIFLFLFYFEKHTVLKSENKNITLLFNTVLTMMQNKGCNEKDDFNREIIETVNAISSVIYSTSFDNPGYSFISKSVEKIFNVPLEEAYKAKFSLLRKIHPADFKKFKRFIAKLKNGESAIVEYRYLTSEKNLGVIKHTGTPILKNGKIDRIAGTISDITEDRQMIAQLKTAEEQFKLLMKTASGLIFNLDKSGYFLSINLKGANNLGYSIENIIGRHFLEFVSEDSKSELALSFQKILSNNHPIRFETVLVNNLGQKLTYQIDATNLKTEGKISGMIGTGRDISVLKKDETLFKQLSSKLTEANRIISIERDRAKEKISILEELNDLKNNFISNVSHELRTPMASIVGFAETIATDQELPLKTILEFNDIILTEGKRLAKLVNDVLDFSKLETNAEELNFTQMDLISLLKEFLPAYKKQAENKGLTFSNEFPESEIFVKVDKERFTRAIGSIVSNAIKFTNSGGRVSIIVQEFLKEVEILVSDTGVGISENNIPKLFQKFSKIDNLNDQQPGAGFGLSTAKQIVGLHGGIIRVTTELGKGSTFIIKLPKQK